MKARCLACFWCLTKGEEKDDVKRRKGKGREEKGREEGRLLSKVRRK